MNKQLLTPVARDNYSHLMRSIDWQIWHKFGSQKEFAKALNIDPSNLSKILTGVTSCSSRTFVEMCRLLDIGIYLPRSIKDTSSSPDDFINPYYGC